MRYYRAHFQRTIDMRVYKAFFYSLDGLKAAFRDEAAFREVVLMAVIGMPLALWRGLPVAHASTLAVNCMVAVEIAYLFNTRTGIRSALGLTALRATRPTWVAIGVLLLLQLAFTYWQPLQRLFTTQALDGGDWLMVGLSAVLTFLIVEVDKAWCRRRG